MNDPADPAASVPEEVPPDQVGRPGGGPQQTDDEGEMARSRLLTLDEAEQALARAWGEGHANAKTRKALARMSERGSLITSKGADGRLRVSIAELENRGFLIAGRARGQGGLGRPPRPANTATRVGMISGPPGVYHPGPAVEVTPAPGDPVAEVVGLARDVLRQSESFALTSARTHQLIGERRVLLVELAAARTAAVTAQARAEAALSRLQRLEAAPPKEGSWREWLRKIPLGKRDP